MNAPTPAAPTAQEIAIAKLERKGFRFSNWFSACDPENPEAQCALMKKRRSGYSTSHCEVDPDGSCNGKPVDEYLAAEGGAR
jgi:hypothetical protein